MRSEMERGAVWQIERESRVYRGDENNRRRGRTNTDGRRG
jgi:hypothetical protein